MRCYDGCPDSEMQRAIDESGKITKRLAKAGMRATYFPMEGAWMVFKDLKAVTGFHDTKAEAAAAAFSNLME